MLSPDEVNVLVLYKIAEYIKTNLNKRHLDYALDENLEVEGFAGGNMDDAYSAGFEHGYALALGELQQLIQVVEGE